MAIRSEISPKHLLRLGIVGLFCLGAAGWFLYDGLVTYPNQRERALKFIEFSEEHSDMDELERLNEWNKLAEEQGWPTGNPGEPFKEYDINGQFIWAGVAGFVGLIFFVRFLLNWGCWVESDDEGLRASGGKELKFAQINRLNKKKWQSKGIAYVHYETNGKNKKLLLDDYIYDRDSMRDIMRKVEDNIDHAKIVNGKPEPPLEQSKAENPPSADQ